MIKFPKELSNMNEHDAIFFLPGDNQNQIQIEAVTYKDPGENIGGSEMGNAYHVILFKENPKTEELYDVDKFEAVFIDPIVYITQMLEQNWFGIVARKTTTSGNFIQNTFDKLKEV